MLANVRPRGLGAVLFFHVPSLRRVVRKRPVVLHVVDVQSVIEGSAVLAAVKELVEGRPLLRVPSAHDLIGGRVADHSKRVERPVVPALPGAGDPQQAPLSLTERKRHQLRQAVQRRETAVVEQHDGEAGRTEPARAPLGLCVKTKYPRDVAKREAAVVTSEAWCAQKLDAHVVGALRGIR
eukprot:7259546-Prymnesium_polylepis.2